MAEASNTLAADAGSSLLDLAVGDDLRNSTIGYSGELSAY